MIAVNDGKIVKVGAERAAGQLHRAPGRDRQHLHLRAARVDLRSCIRSPSRSGSSAREIAKELAQPVDAGADRPRRRAGSQQQRDDDRRQRPRQATARAPRRTITGAGHARRSAAARRSGAAPRRPRQRADGQGAAVRDPVAAGLVRRRRRPAAQEPAPQISSFQNYFSDVLHLAKNQYTLQPLKAGVDRRRRHDPRADRRADRRPTHRTVLFMVQPAGKNAPLDRSEADPRRLEAARRRPPCTAPPGIDPFFGPGAKNPSVGQILLMSKEQLTERGSWRTRTSRSTPAAAATSRPG